MTDSIQVFSLLDRITDDDGNVVAGGWIEFDEAGTSTDRTVYSDANLSVAIGDKVYTDTGGYPVSTQGGTTRVSVYTGTGAYKATVKNSSGAVVIPARDNIRGALDTSPFSTESALPTVPVSAKTAPYTITTSDRGYLFNANPTGGTFVMTLPSAVTAGNNFMVGIRHNGTANQVTLATVSSQYIRGPGTPTSYFSLVGRGEEVWLTSDGADWIVTSYVPALIRPGVIPPVLHITDRLTAAPSSPTAGARYIVNGSPTGTWSTLGFAQHDIAEADGNGSWIKYTPANGWLAYVSDETLYTAFYSSAWNDQSGMAAPSESTLETAVFEHQVANGTAGGASTANAWTTRTLNTSVTNTITGCSLASNEITVAAGVYLVSAAQQLYCEQGSGGVFQGQQRLNPGTAVFSASALGIASRDGSSASATAYSTATARDTWLVTVTTGGTFTLQYFVSVAQSTNGLGLPSTEPSSLVEVYARVSILNLNSLQGPTGAQGAQGTDGMDAAYPYQWSTSTSGDPGSGKIAGNNATIASITQLAISETDSAGGSMAAVIATWDDSTSSVRALVKISKEGATQNFHAFQITGAGTDQGSYRTFPVTYVATSGTISNADSCAVLVIEKGDKGDQGDPGISSVNLGLATEMTTGQIARTADYLYIRDTSAASDKKILPDTFTEPFSFSLGSGALYGSLLFRGNAIFTKANPSSLGGSGDTIWLNEGSASITNTTGEEGRWSTYLGLRCGTHVTTGSYNTFGGFESGERVTTGSYNTFFGEAAGIYATTASSNTVVGWKAMLGRAPQTVSGAADNGSGLIRLTVASTASWTTGMVAVVSSVGGVTAANGSWTITVVDATHVDLQSSTFSGTYTSGGECFVPVTGTGNSIFGYGAGWKITTGTSNMIAGLSAGAELSTGTLNVFVGRDSGSQATTASSSTYVGYEAGRLATTGSNTYVGSGAGRGTANYTGTGNTGVGVSALNKVSGGNNAAFGANAGLNCSTGQFNVFFGSQSGLGISTASSVMAVGYLALNSCNGDNNLAIGLAAGYTITSGVQNLVIGYQAQTGITTGSYNVIIGGITGLSSSLSNAVVIGDQAGTVRLFIPSTGVVGIGGATSSQPGIKASATTLVARLADDSADTAMQATQFQVSGTKVVGARDTGWSAFTGTTNKGTSYATGTVTLAQLAERVAAMQAALTTHGLLGA